MFAVWLVEAATLAPLRLVKTFRDPESGLSSATRVLRGLGAVGVQASNVSWENHEESLLVSDFAGRLSYSMVVTGAVIAEGGVPVKEAVVGLPDSASAVYH